MRVLKFGGTSMGDDKTWGKVLKIIAGYNQPVIIVSATSHTTRQLIAAAEKAVKNLEQAKKMAAKIGERHITLIQNFINHNNRVNSYGAEEKCIIWINKTTSNLNDLLAEVSKTKRLTPFLKDAIASIGEQLSAYLFTICARAYGLPATWVDARNINKTDSGFGHAQPDINKIQKSVPALNKIMQQNHIPVMGGFYGENEQGEITTLGFEGSDYTASLVGAALSAEAIEIWTDVNGIYTCDPRVVKEAHSIPELSFQEATELAYFGAKVLHPSTMKPAAAAHIPIHVKNIFEADHPGTKIHEEKSQYGWAKAMTFLSGITLLTITSTKNLKGYEFLSSFFSILNEDRLPVNAVTTTEASVSVALQDDARIADLKKDLQSLGTIKKESRHGLISLIGCTFGQMNALNQQVLSAIPDVKPSLISYSKTKQNLNIALPETELIPAVCRIHKSVFGD